MLKIIITDKDDLIKPEEVSWFGEKAAAYLGIPDRPIVCHSNLKPHVITELRGGVGGVDLWLHHHEVLGELTVHLVRCDEALNESSYDKHTPDIVAAATTLYTILKG